MSFFSIAYGSVTPGTLESALDCLEAGDPFGGVGVPPPPPPPPPPCPRLEDDEDVEPCDDFGGDLLPLDERLPP